ncbi:reducing type I polyketide synthase 10 [Amniculicola lignicola CBS 123094]|uniref:Reducing type I polyketide synthase 10 n=1 Tax=Amniculicola lignicola CBS 123094 TaxID=1392246 RepID=A0A6A5WBN1_9PLEO|nr:reducing type I polyketide synthase 10 [Amniculicola lignicola CBS 123094]
MSASHVAMCDEKEAIAIVGMGCRLPGGINSPSKLWDFLAQGKSAQGKIPASRFNADGFYDPDSNMSGSMSVDGGYFIDEDLRNFEPSFFGINNVEATYMDPQQRKILEVVYECLENAGLSLEKASGANIGTYVGTFTMDFQLMQATDPHHFHRYSATGMGTTILANRISHVFNLTGPSYVLDTACSSSLYALHAAARALQSGDCDAAIVAGANLIQSPHQCIGTDKAGVLSKTSTCHTFDTTADGYGRADGVGALYVKRLSDALRDGDPIRSVIRATAVNSNGRTTGITQPSADGQEAVIRKAYALTNLSPSATDYIECHGTGTSVGDATEVDGLSRVFAPSRDRSLLIGSVKTNLGHSEAASGISSIIKVTLALEKGIIPPTVGVQNISPKLKLEERKCEIVREMTPWPVTGRSRIASINSFGYGGANAHMILEEAAPYLAHHTARDGDKTLLLPFSANALQSLEALARSLAEAAQSTEPLHFASTLFSRRSKLSHRGYLLAKTSSWRESLRDAPLKTMSTTSKLPLAFVFTGQGAQWSGMGQSLLKEYPSFQRSIRRLDLVLQSLPLSERPDWTLEDVLGPDANEDEIHNPSRSQPICTAVQIGLIRLLSEFNIKPSAVIGHSSGEIAAAYCKGHLTAEQAVIVAYLRGFVAARTPNDGMMLASGMNAKQASAFIVENNAQGKVVVACVNSPENVTLSGDADAIDNLAALLTKKGILARKLKTYGKAYHSHHMVRVGPRYEELLNQTIKASGLNTRPFDVRMVSTVTGEEAAEQIPLPYWRGNLEQPVLFCSGVEELFAKSNYHLVELGPHSALALPLKQIISKVKGAKFNYDSALLRGKDATETVLQLAGNLHLHGHEVNIDRVNGLSSLKRKRPVVDLPPYPWHYDSVLWNEPRASIEFRNQKYPRHELLGSKMPGGNGIVHTWRNAIRIKEVGWLQGHKLDQSTVFPAAGYITVAIEAVKQVTDVSFEQRPSFIIKDIHIEKALALLDENPESGVELITTLQSSKSTASETLVWDFNLSSFAAGSPVQHASGSISIDLLNQSCNRNFVSNRKLRSEKKPTTSWYNKFAEEGLVFDQQFKSLEEIETPTNRSHLQAAAKTALIQGGMRANSKEPLYAIHPATIDAMLQAGIIANTGGIVKDLGAKVPIKIAEIHMQTPEVGGALTGTIRATSNKLPFGAIDVAADLFTENGAVIAQVRGCHAAAYRSVSASLGEDQRHPMLRVIWEPDMTEVSSRHSNALSKLLAPVHVIDKACPLPKSRLTQLLKLVLHQNPKQKVLQLGEESGGSANPIVHELNVGDIFGSCSSYSQGKVSPSHELSLRTISTDPATLSGEFEASSKDDKFDVVVLSDVTACGTELPHIQGHISSSGFVIGKLTQDQIDNFTKVGFELIYQSATESDPLAVLRRIPEPESGLANTDVIIVVVSDSPSRSEDFFASAVVEKLGLEGMAKIQRWSLKDVTVKSIPENAAVVSTVEFERSLLSVMSEEEMNSVRMLTETASTLLWITGGSLLKAPKPEFGLAQGIARSVMLERPSLKFITFDIDIFNFNSDDSVENLLSVFRRAVSGNVRDFEFMESDGLVHVSRFMPDTSMNSRFRERQGFQLAEAAIAEVGTAHVPLTDLVRGSDVFFSQDAESAGYLDDVFVKVDIKALGLDPSVLEHETVFGFSGIVSEVGSRVTSLFPGDRVFVLAPTKIATTATVPGSYCYRIKNEEDFCFMAATLPTFAAATYALHYQARYRKGESVLITDASGHLGQAALQIAQRAGAEVYVIVDAADKGGRLEKRHQLDAASIINRRTGASNVYSLLQATDGRGFDIILNTKKEIVPEELLKACANQGCFVDLSLHAQSNAKLKHLPHGAIWSTADLRNLYDPKEARSSTTLQLIMNDVFQLHRKARLVPLEPLQVFDASDIKHAFEAITSRDGKGVVTLSFLDEKSIIKYRPLPHVTKFHENKTYILIGCLGGLGRSISKWLVERGARNLLFLSRSGTKSPAAKRLVNELQGMGCHVTVALGDVARYADVEAAISSAGLPIGGVVHAAMGLHESLFAAMPATAWHTSIGPKCQGAWNLHNALQSLQKEDDLDFFLLTSSVSGSVGTATESNYCAANHFLDNFAWYRRSLGLPGISVGLGMISEVGYLHENPEIAELLMRKGIQAIPEGEMLQMLDCALGDDLRVEGESKTHGAAHILTGLEPTAVLALRKKGFDGSMSTLTEPRMSLLARAFESMDPTSGSSRVSSENVQANIEKSVKAGKPIFEDILEVLVKKFSNAFLVAVDKLDVNKALTQFGMDSMLGAEIRTWFYQTLGVDVAFFVLLSAETSITALSRLVEKEVQKKVAS